MFRRINLIDDITNAKINTNLFQEKSQDYVNILIFFHNDKTQVFYPSYCSYVIELFAYINGTLT